MNFMTKEYLTTPAQRRRFRVVEGYIANPTENADLRHYCIIKCNYTLLALIILNLQLKLKRVTGRNSNVTVLKLLRSTGAQLNPVITLLIF